MAFNTQLKDASDSGAHQLLDLYATHRADRVSMDTVNMSETASLLREKLSTNQDASRLLLQDNRIAALVKDIISRLTNDSNAWHYRGIRDVVQFIALLVAKNSKLVSREQLAAFAAAVEQWFDQGVDLATGEQAQNRQAHSVSFFLPLVRACVALEVEARAMCEAIVLTAQRTRTYHKSAPFISNASTLIEFARINGADFEVDMKQAIQLLVDMHSTNAPANANDKVSESNVPQDRLIRRASAL